MYSIRKYRAEDFHPVLDFYNKYGTVRHVTERMWKRLVLLDSNFDPSLFAVAEDDDGSILGLIYLIRRLVPIDPGATTEDDRLWINAFAVKPEHLDTIGLELLAYADSTAAAYDRTSLVMSDYTPNYFSQGVDVVHFPQYVSLFERCGFEVVEDSNSMGLSLIGYSFSKESLEYKTLLAKEGIEFSVLSEEDILRTFDYIREHHRPGWAHRLRKLLLDNDDLGRVHIVKHEGKVIGFSMYGDVDTDIQRFGPFGVSSEYRGKKIGRVLLEETLHDMQKAGLEYVWLQHADGEVAPILYRSIGFKETGEYYTLKKSYGNNK